MSVYISPENYCSVVHIRKKSTKLLTFSCNQLRGELKKKYSNTAPHARWSYVFYKFYTFIHNYTFSSLN